MVGSPWLMWGSAQQVVISAGGPVQSGQMVRINYGRPETWRFFFGAELLSVSAPPAADCKLQVAFNVIPGIGRSSFDTTNTSNLLTPPGQLAFAFFQFLIPAGTQPLGSIVTKRWTSAVRAPKMDDDDTTIAPLLETLVAQDLQVAARVSQSTGGPNITAQFQLTAFFAPNVHIRPEWSMDGDPRNQLRYRGGEQNGL